MPTGESQATPSVLAVLRLLRLCGRALLGQAGLHAELARVEWQELKQQLGALLLVAALGLACLLCLLLAAGALAVAFSWDSGWRIPVALGVLLVYAVAAMLAWQRCQALAAQSAQAFAATRTEIAADIALLRSRL
jgi:uncharacterized membrane protein YqjE